MALMDNIVSLCKRRGFLFQSSEIYGGLQGFWDYGPLGVELKRNLKDAWWRDMITGHNELVAPAGAPAPYEMVGLDSTIIMHPQIWKCSGHYDMFHDYMVDCRESKKRYRHDQIRGRWVEHHESKVFVTTLAEADEEQDEIQRRALKFFKLRPKDADSLVYDGPSTTLDKIDEFDRVLAPDAKALGTLTPPREFNLMFKTTLGALGGEDDAAFLRPETAQGIFVNFKNVLDSSRVALPFGIAQVGKSFRNEITPRNFTFRSREFEQMEIEFFCHPNASPGLVPLLARPPLWPGTRSWGCPVNRCIMREHHVEELAHYSVRHRRYRVRVPVPRRQASTASSKGSLTAATSISAATWKASSIPRLGRLVVEKGEDGKPRHRGSGKT